MKIPDAAWWGVGIALVGGAGGAILKSFSLGGRLGSVEARQIGMKEDMTYLRERLDRHIEDGKARDAEILNRLRGLANDRVRQSGPAPRTGPG